MESATTKICPFCGRTIERETITLFNREFLGPWKSCVCDMGKAFYRQQKAKAELDKELREKRDAEEALRRRLSESGIPETMWNIESDEDAVITRCEKIFKSKNARRRSAYLVGAVGVGKTYAAISLCLRRIRRGGYAKFTTFSDLLLRLNDAMHGREESTLDIVERYRRTEFLVLDDVGKEQFSRWASLRFFDIINWRGMALLPTVITSNLPLGILAQRITRDAGEDISAAIHSRLKAMCGVIPMMGEDRRLKEDDKDGIDNQP